MSSIKGGENVKKTVTILLEECNSNINAMEEIIERFQPLIISYSKKSGWKIETEDMQGILTIKLIELVKGMKVYADEGANVKFIANSLRNHFLDVVRKINRLDNAMEKVPISSVEEIGEFDEDQVAFEDMIKGLDKQKRDIIRLKFKEMHTDKEIAEKIGISRQAVNKKLRCIYKQITTIVQ